MWKAVHWISWVKEVGSQALQAAATETLIDAKDIGYQAGDRWLVRHVDLSLKRGEIVTMIGPNGSGKSTTAKMLSGALKPTTGSLQRLPGLRIGYVPQKVSIDQTLPMTLRRLMSLTARPSDAEINQALKAVGIDHLEGRSVQTLSGGEFQRALLARALLREPDLLILDEPVQGVDINAEISVYKIIRDIRDRLNCGILMISHDLHVVMAETDSVLCLNGHVCCRGTPKSVVSNPEYLKIFGPRAAEALAVYQHRHDHTHLGDGRIRLLDGSVTSEDNHDCDHDHDDNAGGHGHHAG